MLISNENSTERLKVIELPVSSPTSRQARIPSSALVAVIVFAALFFLIRFTTDRDYIEAMLPKRCIQQHCQRVERFFVSSENPSMVILGSSTAYVPSQWADVACGAASPKNLMELIKFMRFYKTPAFLNDRLRENGFKDLSVIHLGIPTASLEDQLLILKQAIGLGKTPKLVVLAINPRELFVQPAPDYYERGSPVQRGLADMFVPRRPLQESKLVHNLCVLLRPSVLSRFLCDEFEFFRYGIFIDLRPLSLKLDKYTQVPLRLNVELDPKIVVNRFWINPNPARLDGKPLSNLFQYYRADFVETQTKSLIDLAELLRVHKIRLLIAEVPLYPDVQLSPTAQALYKQAIENSCRHGAVYYRPDQYLSFDHTDFGELLHMNSSGGYKLYSSIAAFIKLKKAELLPDCQLKKFD